MNKKLFSIVYVAILGALIGLLYGEVINLPDYGPWPRIGALLVVIVVVIILVIINEEKK